MLKVLVLICLSSVPRPECQRDTALEWLWAPDKAPSLAMCGLVGQAYAGDSGRVTEGTYAKIFCIPPERMPNGVT